MGLGRWDKSQAAAEGRRQCYLQGEEAEALQLPELPQKQFSSESSGSEVPQVSSRGTWIGSVLHLSSAGTLGISAGMPGLPLEVAAQCELCTAKVP